MTEIFNTSALAQIIEDAVKRAVPQIQVMPDRAWNVKECAAFLGCSTGTVYTLAQNGQIPCQRVGQKPYRFHPGAVADWLAKKENT